MSVEAESARELGRYAVLDEIAAGGMATVHLGRVLARAGEPEFVAIKKMHAQFARDPDFRSMFLDEAQLVRRIEHENVVRTLDVVDGDELLLVMELIEGESLSRLAKQTAQRKERIPQGIVSLVMQHMLTGLHAAHEATNEAGEPLAIVHRDVSPHNVIVGIDGVSRVLDFGVAKARGRMQQTQQGQIKGKLAYMSPEQARGKPVDRRSDVFASGIVLWELLVGARLFDGENEASVLTQLLVEKPPPPSARLKELARLDALVGKALEATPEARYATALEFAEAIAEALPAATAAEVAAWVKVEGRPAIERRHAIRVARAKERIPTAPIARDGSEAREGTPSGISRASAALANKSGVSYVSLPGPKPSSGLRLGAPAPPRATPKPPLGAPKVPLAPASQPKVGPPVTAPITQPVTPPRIADEPSFADAPSFVDAPSFADAPSIADPTTSGPLNERTPPLDAKAPPPNPAPPASLPPLVPPPTFGASSSGMLAVPSHVAAAPAAPTFGVSSSNMAAVPAAPTFGVSSSNMAAVPAAPTFGVSSSNMAAVAPAFGASSSAVMSIAQPTVMEAPPPSHAPLSVSGGWPSPVAGPPSRPPAHPGMTTRMPSIQPPTPSMTPQPPPSHAGAWYGPPSAPPASADAATPPPLAPERVKRLMLIGIGTAVMVTLALVAILIIATSGGSGSTPASSAPAVGDAPTAAPTGPDTKLSKPTQQAAPTPTPSAAPPVEPSKSAEPAASSTPSSSPASSSDPKPSPYPTTSGAKKKKPDYGF